MSWLKLIRWNNLLIIFLTQYFVWAIVVVPERHAFTDLGLLLNYQNFLCLSLSTMLIAAAGYIINDYFDIKIDTINHPEKVVLGKTIPRKTAIAAHAFLNTCGFLLSLYVAKQGHHYEWLLLQIACTTLLWFYSTHFKRQYLSGNIVVSLLTSLTIIALWLYEPVLHREALLPLFSSSKGSGYTSFPVWVIGVYAYFAFFLTWMREIVKDMEDYKGDAIEGCVTMPVIRGLKFARRYTLVLELMVIMPLCIAVIGLVRYDYLILALYMILLLVLPLLLWSYFFLNSFNTAQFHKASTGLKWIMLSGICSLIVYRIQMLIRFGK